MRRISGTNRSHLFVRAPSAQSIVLSGPGNLPIGVSRLRSYIEDTGVTDPHLIEDAFMISVQLKDYSGDIYLRGQKLDFDHQPARTVVIYDYHREWRAYLRSSFDCVNFHIPRAVLNAVAQDQRLRSIDMLRFAPGVPEADPTISGLVDALIPALHAPETPNLLFLSHVGWALGAHVLRTYGEATSDRTNRRGHLASWQERRAKEMIDANLGEDLTLGALAAECGLSTSHFARAFRLTTGMPPYQWLLRRRLDKVQELLREGDLSIAQIADLCGFSDQSHLTRVFTRANGEPPAAWRRRQRG